MDQFYAKYTTYIEFDLSVNEMKQNDLNINLIQYGIANYLLGKIGEKNVTDVLLQ